MKEFFRNVGKGYVILVKLWAFKEGVWSANKKGIKSLWVKCDSFTSINLVNSAKIGEQQSYSFIIYEYKDSLNKLVEMNVTHIHKEGNQVANFLVNIEGQIEDAFVVESSY